MKAIVRISGGIGNQFFQIGFGDYLSLKYNMEVRYDKSFYSTNQKSATEREFLGEKLYPKGRYLDFSLHQFETSLINSGEGPVSKIMSKFSNAFRRISLFVQSGIVIHYSSKIFIGWRIFGNRINHAFIGNWQNHQYLSMAYKEEVFQNLRANSPLTIRIDLGKTIGIHYRRGDYLNANSIHSVLGHEYYVAGLSKIISQNTLDTIIFFSDTELDSPILESFPKRIKASSLELDDLGQVYLMSTLNYLVIANSTYSYMAAVLGNQKKIVVAPKTWYKQGVGIQAPKFPINWICA